MRILGIDPGTARVGWALIQVVSNKATAVAYGCITTPKELDLPMRLTMIYDDIRALIHKHSPDAMAIEELFFSNNAKTVIPVGQSRGVILLAGAHGHLPITSYTPLTVKQTITGSGKADKKQIQKMIEHTLKISVSKLLDDTTDAIAIALTHAYSYRMKQL